MTGKICALYRFFTGSRKDAPVRHRRRGSVRALFAWTFACCILTSSCREPLAHGDGLVRVHYGGNDWLAHIPVIVGIETGIFDKAGFDVRFRANLNTEERVARLRSYDAQAADSAKKDPEFLHVASVGLVGLLLNTNAVKESLYLIGCPLITRHNEALVVSKDHPDVRDMESFTAWVSEQAEPKVHVPFGTSAHLTTLLALQQAKDGQLLEKVQIVDTALGDVAEVIRDGGIGALWDPELSRLLGEGARVLRWNDQNEIFEKHFMVPGPDLLCCSKEWYDQDQERANRFLGAYFAAVAWCAEKPAAQIAEIVLRNPAFASSSWAGLDKTGTSRLAATLESVRWLKWHAQRLLRSEQHFGNSLADTVRLLSDRGLVDDQAALSFASSSAVWAFEPGTYRTPLLSTELRASIESLD